MAIITVVEALHRLKLWYESFGGVVAPLCHTVEIYFGRAMFRSTGKFFVFASEEGYFRDSSIWEAVSGFEEFNFMSSRRNSSTINEKYYNLVCVV